jgi:hypothetical protein
VRIAFWLVSILVCTTLAVAPPAFANALVVSSGQPGGYYEKVALGLRAVLRSEHHTDIAVRTSHGSLENLALLDDPASSVALALTQVDALKHYITENPEFAEKYVELADVGKECVFIITNKESGIQSIGDLKSDPPRNLAVGKAGSGAAVTWEYMNRLEPAFRRTRAVDLGVIEALLKLKQDKQPSQISAVMIVQRPRAVSTPVEIVLAERDEFEIIPVRAGDIDASALGGGRTVYSFEKVSVGFGRDYQVSFDTLCTRGLLIGAKPKLDDDQLGVLAEALDTSRAYIAPSLD